MSEIVLKLISLPLTLFPIFIFWIFLLCLPIFPALLIVDLVAYYIGMWIEDFFDILMYLWWL